MLAGGSPARTATGVTGSEDTVLPTEGNDRNTSPRPRLHSQTNNFYKASPKP